MFRVSLDPPSATPPSAAQWLRVALFAAIAAAAATVVFDLAIGERVVNRAVGLEEARETGGALSALEPFSRQQQQGGLAVGGLLFAAAVGLLLAGAATFLAPRSRSVRRLWLLLIGACLWGAVALPAITYPPLPPGVESELAIEARQTYYLIEIAVGIAGFALAVHLWAKLSRVRFSIRAAVAGLAAIVPAALAVTLLPDQGADSILAPDLVRDFRLVSIGSQVLFWLAFAAVGALALRRIGTTERSIGP